MESIINSLEKTIIEHSNFKHNHPPVRFKVHNCPYCKKYGNVFELKH